MITQVRVFGLRCSGTNYIAELIRLNYPHLRVDEGGPGWKHMWQGERTFRIESFPGPSERKSILYIFVSRDVFETLQSFNKNPHHCKWARGISLDELLHVSPFESFENRKLESYPSILEERNRKYQNIIDNIHPKLPNSCLVKYESIRDEPDILRALLNEFGISRDEPVENVEYYKKEKSKVYVPKTYKEISSSARQFITDNVNWDLEAKWGYIKPRESSDETSNETSDETSDEISVQPSEELFEESSSEPSGESSE